MILSDAIFSNFKVARCWTLNEKNKTTINFPFKENLKGNVYTNKVQIVVFSVSRKQLLISKNIEDPIPGFIVKKGKKRSLVPGVTSARQKDRVVQGEKNISEILKNVLKVPM